MENLIQAIRNLGPTRLGAIIGIGLTLISFSIFMVVRFSADEMQLLYGDLDAQTSNEVIAQLTAQQIPFQLQGDGTQVLVPAEQVGELRLQLAGLGVSGSVIGYEIFDRDTALGTSSFVQEVNRLRALEGELSRTVSSLSIVKSARVHLVLPRRELFSRESQSPTASVILKMRGATRLNKQQVLAIQQLVATAVPKLKPENISIIDDRGSLLSRGAGGAASSANGVEDLRQDIENRMRNNIEELLARTVGFGKVRAEVTAEIDLEEIVINEDLFDPESQVLRSSETIEENSSLENAGENPVSVENNLPEGLNAGSGIGGQREADNRIEERNNFEISRTRRNTVVLPGTLKKLSVAVLVDGTYTRNEAGGLTYNPRTIEEMQQFEKLVKSAIGFDDQIRNDVVEIINMRFVNPPELDEIEEKTFFGFMPNDVKWMLQALILGVLGMLIIFLVVRPLIKSLLESRKLAQAQVEGEDQPLLTDLSGNLLEKTTIGDALVNRSDVFAQTDDDTSEAEGMIDIANIDGRVRESSMRKIGEIIDKHPDETVSIIRNWLHQENN